MTRLPVDPDIGEGTFDFIDIEREMVAGQVTHAMLGLEPGNGDRGNPASEHQDARGIRQRPEEAAHRPVDGIVLDQRIVIEDERHRKRVCPESFENVFGGDAGGRRGGSSGRLVDGLPQAEQKEIERVVGAANRKPAGPEMGVTRCPLASQHRLAIPGRGRDQGDRRLFRFVDEIEQPRPLNDFR